jgi:NADPH:quinone reductase-like Zn-dependent oxidoreductase
MRAVVLERTGSAAELHCRDWPEPEISGDGVLVKVHAAGVCGRDLIDRRGGFPMMKLPTVLGHEFAGEVVAVGSEVREFSRGNRVANLHRPWCGDCASCVAGETIDCERAWQSFGHTIDGAYAELVAAPARALVKIPEGVDDLQAASLGCTAAVAFRALTRVAGVRMGETVLVTGASGGVGLAALGLARLAGARVIATTGSESKAEALRAAGADEVVVMEEGGFAGHVKSLTGGGGVNVALELTGAATFKESLRSLRPHGRLVVIGNIDVGKVSVSLGPLILFAHRIVGMRSYSRFDLETCFDLVKRGRLRPVVDRTLPLEKAREAHELLESRAVTGRVMLLP